MPPYRASVLPAAIDDGWVARGQSAIYKHGERTDLHLDIVRVYETLGAHAVLARNAGAGRPAGHNSQVSEAAKNPGVAAVLKEVDAIDAAIVAGDKDGFIRPFAEDAIVNSPFNNVATKAMAAARYRSGVLTCKYLHRSIEYAASRRDDEVVLMGEESYEPSPGNMFAGKTLRRRFTLDQSGISVFPASSPLPQLRTHPLR